MRRNIYEMTYRDFDGDARNCLQCGYAEALKQVTETDGRTIIEYVVYDGGINNYADSYEQASEWLANIYRLKRR